MIDEILAKLPEGVFTLRDRVAQVLDVLKVGPVGAQNPTMQKFTREYLRDELELPSGDGMIKTWVIEDQDHLTLHGLIFSDEEQPSGYA